MQKKLLAIIEQGGYPDFRPLYQAQGFEVETLHNMRKAMSYIKKHQPQVVVAEFNYQSDFRDRTSSLESMLATIEQVSKTIQGGGIQVIIFYDSEYRSQLAKLQAVFSNFVSLPFPIDQGELGRCLSP